VSLEMQKLLQAKDRCRKPLIIFGKWL